MFIYQNLSKIIFLLLFISFSLLAVSTYSFGNDQYNTVLWTILSILTLISLIYSNKYIKFLLAIFMVIVALEPVGQLFTSNAYNAMLGGFPVIGKGQGYLKYLSLIALAIYIVNSSKSFINSKVVEVLNYFPVAIVMLWIGGMKFTAIEAKGIFKLVDSSPFMSWLYSFFTVQQTSNIIGTFDILIILILTYGVFKSSRLFTTLGVLGALALFLTTQTFLLSYSGATSSTHILEGTGMFIIKDLWFISNLLVIYIFRKKHL